MRQTDHETFKANILTAEILTTAEMRALEQAAIDSGAVTGLDLMERAGQGAADIIRRRWPSPGQAVVLCGPGNNGGDGFVVAHHLRQSGWRVRVGLPVPPARLPPDAATMCRRWCERDRLYPLTTALLRDPHFRPDLVIDAVFGTGLARAPEGDIASLLKETTSISIGLQGRAAPALISLDCPSGLDLDSGYPLGGGQPFRGAANIPISDLTITFHSLKPGHLTGDGPDYCGEIEVVSIGLPTTHRARPVRPPVTLGKRGGHKFTHGHVLIVAGGFGAGGAARLAARAALRVGAGLVTLGPTRGALIEHSGPPDALMRRGVDDGAALAALLDDPRMTAVALGPGCGVARAAQLLGPVLASGRAAVLDADALTALAAAGTQDLHDHCILTPHLGEFARLFPDLADRLGAAQGGTPGFGKLNAAREAARRSGAVVVLKGPDTVIAAPDGQARIHSAPDLPWLATAGAGDVLTGIIAGLLARGRQPLDAAATGAFLHAAAARRFGPGLIADDLPDQLPGVLRDLGA